jgi:diguanylate cyclase (GGDEF)-like protein
VQNVMRKTDLIGRTGGEEFLIVLPDTPIEGAALLAERVRAALEAQVSIGDPPMPVTASFGVASLSADCRSLDALQAVADQALYVAKRKGRNRVELETAPVGRA